MRRKCEWCGPREDAREKEPTWKFHNLSQVKKVGETTKSGDEFMIFPYGCGQLVIKLQEYF